MHYRLSPDGQPPFWRDAYRLQKAHRTYAVHFDIRPQQLPGFDFCSFTAVVDDVAVGGCCGSLNWVPALEGAALSAWLRPFLTPAHQQAGIVPNDVGHLVLGEDRFPSIAALWDTLGFTVTAV